MVYSASSGGSSIAYTVLNEQKLKQTFSLKLRNDINIGSTNCCVVMNIRKPVTNSSTDIESSQPHPLFHSKREGGAGHGWWDGEDTNMYEMLLCPRHDPQVGSAGKFCCSVAIFHHLGCPGNVKQRTQYLTTSHSLQLLSGFSLSKPHTSMSTAADNLFEFSVCHHSNFRQSCGNKLRLISNGKLALLVAMSL